MIEPEEEKQPVYLAWKAPYGPEGQEAFLKTSARVAHNLLSYTSTHYRQATQEEYERFAKMVAEQRPPISCHRGELNEGINGLTRWEERDYSGYRHCSYCGSLHPDDLRAILQDGGRLGGSDWKYGNPHKFYVYHGKEMLKWYNKHLADLDDEILEWLFPLLHTYSGIKFEKKEGEIWYQAPYYGYQRA